jgi:hypothetical protein
VTDTWPFLITIFSLLALTFITWRFLFNKDFRDDVLSSKGEVNVKNHFTVKGSAFLVIYTILILASFSPLINDMFSFQTALHGNSILSLRVSPNDFIQEYTDNKTELDKLKVKLKTNYVHKEKLPNFIKDLSPSAPLSKLLYDIPYKELGPWNKFSESQLVSVSIPSKHIEKGKALACDEYYGGSYELTSAIKVNNTTVQGGVVNVIANQYIFRSSDCRKQFKYKLQISCDDAKTLFTQKVLTCEGQEAKWQTTQPEQLLVRLISINPDDI